MNIDKTLVQQLDLAEKAALVSGKDFWFTAGITKINLARMMVTDGPSGLRKQADSADALGLNQSVTAVCFPSSALTACSFDRSQLQQLGHYLGQAAKAERVGVLLGPGINLKRSPLAGRNFEYFSEDPYLAGELASAYINGVQAEGVGVSVKHFAANNRENQRFTMSSNVDERTLRELYLAPFEKVVKTSQPATVMCSYNAINGALNSQNQKLLTKILRDEWGFKGLVMSDWGAVADHVAALKAGLDLEMPGKGQPSVDEIVAAVLNKQLSEPDLDRAVWRVLQMINDWQPADEIPVKYDLEQQHEFARQLAAKSFVLLKNDHQVLPVQTEDSIVVMGELAKHPRFQGGGSSHVNAYRVTIPLDVIQQEHKEAAFELGYRLTDQTTDDSLIEQAVATAKSANKVIIFAGFPAAMESEGFDKTSLSLPANQNRLIQAVTAVNANVTVVLQNGSVVLMPWVKQVAAVVETYLAGEAVGEATWDVLSGRVNPAGKLAESFPLRLEDTPSYLTFNADPTEENYREGLFIGYRYYDKKKMAVQFPFGFGLSYTQFAYHDLSLSVGTDAVIGSIAIENIGHNPGTQTIQIYVSNQTSQVEMPAKTLANFVNVELRPGETKDVNFTLPKRVFSWYNERLADWQVDNGKYEVLVGIDSKNIKLQQSIELNWTASKSTKIGPDSYIGDIVGREDVKTALEQTGLAKTFAQISNGDSTDDQMMLNMPLRAAVMVGATSEQIKGLIQLVNKA